MCDGTRCRRHQREATERHPVVAPLLQGKCAQHNNKGKTPGLTRTFSACVRGTITPPEGGSRETGRPAPGNEREQNTGYHMVFLFSSLRSLVLCANSLIDDNGTNAPK